MNTFLAATRVMFYGSCLQPNPTHVILLYSLADTEAPDYLCLFKKQSGSEGLESQLNLSPAKKNTYVKVMAEGKTKTRPSWLIKDISRRLNFCFSLKSYSIEIKTWMYWLKVSAVYRQTPHYIGIRKELYFHSVGFSKASILSHNPLFFKLRNVHFYKVSSIQSSNSALMRRCDFQS